VAIISRLSPFFGGYEMTGLKRRKVSYIPVNAETKENIPYLVNRLVNIIENTEWKYTSDFKDTLIMRDKALVAFLFLTGLRISEATEIRLSDFRATETIYYV
jgi:integrase